MKFLIAFVLIFLVIYFIDAINYLRRIAEALEDYVYDDDDEAEESEVK